MKNLKIVRDLTPENIRKGSLCILNISRQEVESQDLTPIKKALATFKVAGLQGRQKLGILFDGYNDVVEEIYEIPEIRAYCMKIVEEYPWVYYYLTNFKGMMDMFTACISDFVRVANPVVKPISQFSFEELLNPPKYAMKISLPEETRKLIFKGVILHGFELQEHYRVVADVLWEIPGQLSDNPPDISFDEEAI